MGKKIIIKGADFSENAVTVDVGWVEISLTRSNYAINYNDGSVSGYNQSIYASEPISTTGYSKIKITGESYEIGVLFYSDVPQFGSNPSWISSERNPSPEGFEIPTGTKYVIVGANYWGSGGIPEGWNPNLYLAE